jgi:transcriptional regulator with XRE-family HTH domain
MSAKSLANKIKQARIEAELKQSELAARMGISAQLISAFETGRIRPERQYLEKIAQFTHKPVYFFTGQKVAEALSRIEEMMKELQEIREILHQAVEGDEDLD